MDDSDEKTLNVSQPTLPAASGGAFEKGQILISKYKVIAPLGSGGMGTVYRVQHISLNKEFALKTLDSHKISDIAMMRFQTEARAASLLDHPNLVKVHDFGLLESGEPFLVMDIVRGITVADRLEADGPFEVDRASRLFAQVCLGLSYAHDKGVVHRDIKPSNIMLVDGVEEGTEGSVKVVDFGIAKLMDSEDGTIQALTRTGEIFGSPLYMSPEQCSGDNLNYRTDIYSLGCVLYEALTGAPPHLGLNALTTMLLHQTEPAAPLSEGSLGKIFPVALEQIVAKMLKKVPTERYSNIGLVALDLSAVGGESSKAQSRFASGPQAKPPQAPPPEKEPFNSTLALAALCVALVTGIGGYLYGLNNIHPTAQRVRAPKLETENQDSQGALEGFLSSSAGAKKSNTMAPITSHLRLRNGLAERVFNFPPYPIGSVRWANGTSFLSRAANGDDVYMPAGKPVIFEVDALKYPGIVDNPAVFKKIGPTEFGGLTIKGARLMDEETVITMLRAARSWSALEALVLQDVPGDKIVLSNVNNLGNVRDLRLSHLTDVDPVWIAKQPFISRAETLYIANFDVAPLIHQQAKVGNLDLHSLGLEDTNVTAESLAELRGCPGLTTLILDLRSLSDEQVRAVTQIKSLVVVNFKNQFPNEKQLKILLADQALCAIYLPGRLAGSAHQQTAKKLAPRRILFDGDK